MQSCPCLLFKEIVPAYLLKYACHGWQQPLEIQNYYFSNFESLRRQVYLSSRQGSDADIDNGDVLKFEKFLKIGWALPCLNRKVVRCKDDLSRKQAGL